MNPRQDRAVAAGFREEHRRPAGYSEEPGARPSPTEGTGARASCADREEAGDRSGRARTAIRRFGLRAPGAAVFLTPMRDATQLCLRGSGDIQASYSGTVRRAAGGGRFASSNSKLRRRTASMIVACTGIEIVQPKDTFAAEERHRLAPRHSTRDVLAGRRAVDEGRPDSRAGSGCRAAGRRRVAGLRRGLSARASWRNAIRR